MVSKWMVAAALGAAAWWIERGPGTTVVPSVAGGAAGTMGGSRAQQAPSAAPTAAPQTGTNVIAGSSATPAPQASPQVDAGGDVIVPSGIYPIPKRSPPAVDTVELLSNNDPRDGGMAPWAQDVTPLGTQIAAGSYGATIETDTAFSMPVSIRSRVTQRDRYALSNRLMGGLDYGGDTETTDSQKSSSTVEGPPASGYTGNV